MKKYNNNIFPNVNSSMGDATMRFNKRPRFGGGPNINSSAPRYPHQNQTSYQQYSQNRNNVTETYKSSQNQFESGSRHFYGQGLPNRPPAPLAHSHAMQNQALPSQAYTHKLGSAASLSPSASVFSPTKPNTLKPPPKIQNPTANASSTSSIPKNNHPQQLQQQQQPSQHVAQNLLDNSSYYGYGYNNFYSSYNTEMMASTSTSTFSMPDTMSSYMWQTITSTPPPQLPSQQMQLPLPPPPLPQQQPPVLPPLPSAEKPTALQPPPPLPILPGSTSPTPTDDVQNKPNDKDTASKTIVKIKSKRNSMSTRYKLSKSWSEVDAAMAIKAEEANARRLQKDIILVLRFPDPEISRDIVKCYSPDIESVHFQLNFAPRYCLVHLKPGTDVEKTMETLSKIPFGNGHLSVEIKQIPHKVHTTKLTEIDPYTLYVGNLPTTIACKTLKDHFPGAVRIDIGFAQRMKYTRYAFIRYKTVQQAIEAYKRMLDSEIGGRSLTIRFRRMTSANEVNKDGDAENDDVHDDVLSQTTVVSEDNSVTLNPGTESSENLEQNNLVEDLDSNKEKNTHDPPNKTGDLERNNDIDVSLESNTLLTNSQASSVETENNLNETNSCNPNNSIEDTDSAAASSESTTTVTQSTTLLNIKPDPDMDPDDMVVRSDNVTTRFDINEESIKQEKELASDFEFFAPANNNQSCAANREKSATANDTVSIYSTTDETDTMSTMSASSLGEFLQTCQRPRVTSNDIDDIVGPPPAKRNKQYSDDLSPVIKTEPFEQQTAPVEDNLPVQENVAIKRETVDNYVENINNDNAMQSNNANRRVSRRNKNQKISSNDTDDVVPPNALFLRGDIQTPLASNLEMFDNDEFFETRTKPTAQIISAIKTEPINATNRFKESEKNKSSTNYQHLEILSNSRSNNEKSDNSLQAQATTNETTLAGDEEDLVPERNILCTRLNTHTDSNQQSFDIKLERENEDIFSIPCVSTVRNEVTSNQNEDSNLSDLWNTNLLTQNTSLELSNNENPIEFAKSHTPVDDNNDDDDIILVSENISQQQPKYSNSKSSLVKTDSSLSYKNPDLLTFTPKTTAAVTTLESCKLLPHHHHDNLDKLFEELDADSDSEL